MPGVRYFGPGEHEPGLIELKDGETLYLAPGSLVKGQVRSVGTKDVSIRGRGVLDAPNMPRRGGLWAIWSRRAEAAGGPPASDGPWRSVGRRAAKVPPEERNERATFRGRIRNIRVTNMHVADGRLPFSVVAGFGKDYAVENVVVEGLKHQGRPIRNASEGKFSADHAPGFKIR